MDLVGLYKQHELAVLIFTAHLGGDPDCYEEVLADVARALDEGSDCPLNAAMDTDLGSAGDGWAWSCLVLAEEVAAWMIAAEAHGYDVEVQEGPVEAGHYGDGHWAGVDLCQEPRGDRLYWIDCENAPGTAAARRPGAARGQVAL